MITVTENDKGLCSQPKMCYENADKTNENIMRFGDHSNKRSLFAEELAQDLLISLDLQK